MFSMLYSNYIFMKFVYTFVNHGRETTKTVGSHPCLYSILNVLWSSGRADDVQRLKSIFCENLDVFFCQNWPKYVDKKWWIRPKITLNFQIIKEIREKFINLIKYLFDKHPPIDEQNNGLSAINFSNWQKDNLIWRPARRWWSLSIQSQLMKDGEVKIVSVYVRTLWIMLTLQIEMPFILIIILIILGFLLFPNHFSLSFSLSFSIYSSFLYNLQMEMSSIFKFNHKSNDWTKFVYRLQILTKNQNDWRVINLHTAFKEACSWDWQSLIRVLLGV
jgi:hypothetical protein